VGPVCAGKSAVARRLEQLGAKVYEADALVRQLYDHPDVREEVRRLFGASVFDESGKVNRGAIASRIFGPEADAELRRRLTEEIIFPRTGQLLRARLDAFRATARPDDILVLDAPTLFEAGRAEWCDRILWVTAPLERRRHWARERGWPNGELERREAAMLPQETKRQRAHYVIDNTGSLPSLQGAVDQVWARLRRGGDLEKKPASE
jgi:dephospho-CoA kinase